MNTAKAAAAVSTPTVKGGIYLDSFDARIIEYQSAIVKLDALIKHVKALQIKIRTTPTLIPLIHYIVILTGPLLNISEILSKRLEQLGKLLPVHDQRKVAPSVNISALNFEIEDTQPQSSIKYDEHTKELLPSLLMLYENALAIYQNKLQQSIVERDANRLPGPNGKPIPLDLSIIKDLLEPMELNVFSKLAIEPQESESYQFKRIPLVIDSINKSIGPLKNYLQQLQSYKMRPNDSVLKKLPHWHYTIHRTFATFVKLSELYTILRKLGRELYLPVDEYLHNPKILHNNVKLELSLKDADEYLKNTRKNQNLVFTLAKATRQGSYFHVKSSTIIEFTNSLAPSISLISKMSLVILNLARNWELAESKLLKIEQEMKQREKNSRVSSPTSPTADGALNSKKLEVLFNPEKNKLSQEYIAKQQREREKHAIEDRIAKEKADKERAILDEQKAKKKVEVRERQLREELTKDRGDLSPNVSRQSSIRNTRVRSNSNSSVSSNSSASSLNALTRSDSISSPRITSPTTLSRSSSLQKRPASVYISSPAFDIRTQLRRQQAAAAKESPKSATASPSNNNDTSSPVGNRRRSQSLQSSIPSTEQNNTMVAAAAGAAALKQERHSSLKSKAEIKNQEILKRKQQQQTLQAPPLKPQSRSPSPLRAKNPKTTELPNISELALDDTPSKPKKPLKSALVTKKPQQLTSPIPKRSQPSSPTPKKSQPSSPTPQAVSTLTVPDLINETTSESSDSTYENQPAQGAGSPKSLETIKADAKDQQSTLDETSSQSGIVADSEPESEPEQPMPIVKKVRFTGVPDEIEDEKPKRKGWIRPPKIQFAASSSAPNGPRSALSTAADALQQERMIFHNIKRGELDVNTGAIVFPNTSNKRVMNTLAASTNNNHKLGRWRLGLNK